MLSNRAYAGKNEERGVGAARAIDRRDHRQTDDGPNLGRLELRNISTHPTKQNRAVAPLEESQTTAGPKPDRVLPDPPWS